MGFPSPEPDFPSLPFSLVLPPFFPHDPALRMLCMFGTLFFPTRFIFNGFPLHNLILLPSVSPSVLLLVRFRLNVYVLTSLSMSVLPHCFLRSNLLSFCMFPCFSFPFTTANALPLARSKYLTSYPQWTLPIPSRISFLAILTIFSNSPRLPYLVFLFSSCYTTSPAASTGSPWL